MTNAGKRLLMWAGAAAVLSAGAVGIAVATGEDGDEARGERGRDCRAELPRGSERAKLDPGAFGVRIDNPYWPMRPGSRWVYRETDQEGARQRVVVTVTQRTKQVANGVTARVVRDRVTEDGRLVEDTLDWYAQDRCGNIWYLGEDVDNYEGGKLVDHAGSWEAGVDGAQAGVVMPAKPRVGLQYRQEHYAGEAEDRARILSLDEQVEVPFGHFTGVLLTKDYTPLEPKVLEYKLYARGVGPALTLSPSGGAGAREELLGFRR